jgi:quinol-cytochrome oxidoreductase complex cytochrome b subunit
MSETPDPKKRIPFFPNYILDEMIAWYVALALLVVLASLFPAGLEEKADPLSTPAHIKPEWYFLFLYQALKWVPRLVGVLMPGIAIVLLVVLPFIDRGQDRSMRDRRLQVLIGLIMVVVVLALTVWGWSS